MPNELDGAALIAAERHRQVAEEGWTPEHDARHAEGELVRAAQAGRTENEHVVTELARTGCCTVPSRMPRGEIGLTMQQTVGLNGEITGSGVMIVGAQPRILISAELVEQTADIPPDYVTMTPGIVELCDCGCGRLIPHIGAVITIAGLNLTVAYKIDAYICAVNGYTATRTELTPR